jgi:hypothetical protein
MFVTLFLGTDTRTGALASSTPGTGAEPAAGDGGHPGARREARPPLGSGQRLISAALRRLPGDAVVVHWTA